MNYGASNNLIGGTGQSQRNVLTGNGFAGVDVSHGDNTTGNQVIGNFIGTNTSGTGAVANCSGNRLGVRVKDGVRNNVISDNVISGNRDSGIEIQSPPTNGNVQTTVRNTIRNNRIGILVDGTALPNSVGILINGRNNTIGPGNIIAHNRDDGIQLRQAASDFNVITRNSIFGNSGIGIDLAPNGVTQNDSGDGDTGPNENLNFPVLSGATTSQVTGTACGPKSNRIWTRQNVRWLRHRRPEWQF
jgi:parallel beta-helix repeat protein